MSLVDDNKKGYIYAIPDSTGRIKVGKTKNKNQRVRNLQTAHADDLIPLYWLEVDDMTKAENSAREILKQWHVKREWYRFDRQGMEMLRKVFNIDIVPDKTYKQLKMLGLRKDYNSE